MARLIVGNWKMHLDPPRALKLVQQLDAKVKPNEVTIVLCPPTVDLYAVAGVADETKFKLGVQNIHYEDEGAFTGETSASMVRSVAHYAIIGHSERRAMGEDDKLIAKKVAAAERNGLTPILCVGEDLHQRESNLSVKVVVDQLEAGLAHLTADDVSRLVVAYEPLWAISKGDGHGHSATPDAIRSVINAIHQTVEDLYGEAGGTNVRVLYGGSANPDNCRAYLKAGGIDGLLVGGESLNAEDFAKMVELAGQ